MQRRGHAEFADGDELVKPLARASRRIRVLLLDRGGELLDPGFAVLRAQLPCGPQHSECLVVELFRQVDDHVAHLVVATALHEASVSEDLADSLAQHLGAVEDEEPGAPGVQTTLDEVLE